MHPEHYNHPSYKSINVDRCYLCGESLGNEPTNKDHIIPDCMFPKGAKYRPQLIAHAKCNSDKTKFDKRFKARILMMTTTNPTAARVLYRDLLEPASQQLQYLGMPDIDHRLSDLKFLKTIGNDFRKESEINYNGQDIVEISASKGHRSELNSYAYKMAQGLFIRNVPGIMVGRPRLHWVDLAHMTVKGKPTEGLTILLRDMIAGAKKDGSLFSQSWPGHISYCGAELSDVKNAGFVWICFYDQFGVLAIFKPKRTKKK